MAKRKTIIVYESVVNLIKCDGKKLYIYDKLTGHERILDMNPIYAEVYKKKAANV